MKTTKRKTRAVRLRTYEVILAGFDASTDRTDDLVKWVNAPHLAAVRAFIKHRALSLQMAPRALPGPMRLPSDGVDVTLDAKGRVTKGCALGWTGQKVRVHRASVASETAPVRIIIDVKGGNVQGVFASDPSVHVSVLDYDNEPDGNPKLESEIEGLTEIATD